MLTTQMKSVGEVMAIGRTFKESLQKALRGLEVGRFGLGCDKKDLWGTARQPTEDEIKAKLATPNAERDLVHPLRACSPGMSVEQIHALTGIDPWFLANIEELVELEGRLRAVREPGRGRRRPDPRGQAERLLRPAARHALGHDRGRGPPRPPAAGHPRRLQAGRHLRRRVRGGHALLLFDLRARGRGAGRREAAGGDPGRRARTGSARGSSSTTAAARPPSRCGPTATRWSWSTPTPRPSAPTTTPRTGCSSSR